MYIVYAETISGSNTSRWFCGCYKDVKEAERIASTLNESSMDWHFVCKAGNAKGLRIQNLPEDLR